MNRPGSDDPLLARLMDLPPAERPAFCERWCSDDPGLRARSPEVSRLLATAPPAPVPGTALPLSADAMANALRFALDPGDRETVGLRIGPYKLLQRIGEGGFGTVWMADQQEPLRRHVALKILKVGMDTEEVIARFEVERQALALMDHPNIARVFDAGATVSGRPYFVMELVRGVPITHYCDQHRLTAAARLNLFVAVCQAVQHAHQKGVIHRDIKPSNILVTLHDGTPVPKIIDFGIAKATDRKLSEKTLVTQFHAFVGTPVYTSPEQMEMSGLDVDTRSDIYSLGVLLYELLAGRPPFDAAALLKAGLEAMRRTIREVDPPRPSNRLGTLPEADRTSVAQQRGTDATKLALLLRGDVDWIVMRCLEKDRTRRYETAAALALDIERHLQHEPVAARPPSSAYRIGKFVRRHRVGVAAASAVAVSLVAGLIVASTLFVRERAARQRAVVAEQSESRLRQQADAARLAEAKRASRTSQALAEQLLREGRTGESLAHFVRAARSDPENHALGPRLLAVLGYRSFALPIGAPILDAQRGGYTRDGRQLWTYHTDNTVRFRDLATGNPAQSFVLPDVAAADESADGRRWAIAGIDDRVVVLDIATGRTGLGPLPQGGRVLEVRFSPDGRWLATAVSNLSAKIWDAGTGQLRATLPHTTPLGTVTFSPDSRRLVTTASSAQWRVWSVPDGVALTPSYTARTQANQALFSPDGKLLVITDGAGALMADSEAGFALVQKLDHDGPCYAAEFSRDGTLLATTSDDATAKVWEMPSGQLHFPPFPHGGLAREVHFSATGRHLVTRSLDGMVRVWNLTTGQLAQEPIGAGQVRGISVAPERNEFLTYNRDRTASRWQAGSGAIRPLFIPAEPDRWRILADADSEGMGWGLYRHGLQRIDLLTGRKTGALRPWPAAVFGGVLASGATHACVDLGGGEWELWDLRGAEVARHPLGHYRELRSLVFSGDASFLAAIDAPRNLRVWETRRGTRVVGPIEGSGRFFTFSPDHRLLAAPMLNGTVTLWDIASGSRVGEPLCHRAPIQAVRFSPDGKFLVCGSHDGVAQLWDVRTRRPVGPPLSHHGFVRGAAFSGDGQRLLTWDPLDVHLWDVPTGTPLSEPMVGGNDINLAIFSTDETRVATWARSATDIRLWDSRSGQMIAGPIGGAERLGDVMGPLGFIAGGRFLTIATVSRTLFVWPLPPPERQQPVPEWLLTLAGGLAGGEVDANAVFREGRLDLAAIERVRSELSQLPKDDAYAEWGRWFLADRSTRAAGPGLKISAAEAERFSDQTKGRP
ncbi:MAG: protein kinase [Verrucomicrobia bacterium]|nr:protein kinase [Verrucomicrobiota bacterium]